jgi:hypothetical protein
MQNHQLHDLKGGHDKKPFECDKNKPYSPEGTFNLKCLIDECALHGVNSTLRSRQKLFNHVRLSG